MRLRWGRLYCTRCSALLAPSNCPHRHALVCPRRGTAAKAATRPKPATMCPSRMESKLPPSTLCANPRINLMTPRTDGPHEKRLQRIRHLGAELNDQCQHDPYASRAHCVRLAEELISLLDAEDPPQ